MTLKSILFLRQFSHIESNTTKPPKKYLVFKKSSVWVQDSLKNPMRQDKTIQFLHTAKTQYRKFETNFPRKGSAQLQSQFLHSCFCKRFIYSPDLSAYSAAGK